MKISQIFFALLPGLLGGVVVAFVNYFLSKRRTEAEIGKLEAETDKMRAETRKIIHEFKGLSASVNYTMTDIAENIIYDSSTEFQPYDFQGVGGQCWYQEEWTHKGPKGKGSLKFEEGNILNIQRTNTEGRFEVWLQRYLYDNIERTCIPKNELIAVRRKIHVSCQAKVVGGEHSLDFVWKNQETTLAYQRVMVTINEWLPIDLYFQFSPQVDCLFRIDDLEVSRVPSSIQIRNLLIAERTT